jgi:hypothetical protein
LKKIAMALATAPLLCLFTVALDIFMLKKDIAKTHCINVELNVQNNAPLMVYHVALVGNWLVMGLKTDNSPVDSRLSKMEVEEHCVSCGNWQPCGQLAHGMRGGCGYYN